MNAVDTNVLIYVNDPRDLRKQSIAARIVKDLDAGVLLWQVVCEFLSASRKLAPFVFGAGDAWRYIERLGNAWKVEFPTWNVQTHAYVLTQRYSIAYWDALLLGACKDAGIERLYSEDLDTHDGIDGLEIINPFRNP